MNYFSNKGTYLGASTQYAHRLLSGYVKGEDLDKIHTIFYIQGARVNVIAVDNSAREFRNCM